MKKQKLMMVIIYTALCTLSTNIFAQSPNEIMFKAMRDELKRNINNLTLEDLKRPFYISYTISDARALEIKSSLGAIVSSKEGPVRGQKVRVLVGDYQLDNENYFELNSSFESNFGSESIPLDNDYYGIRRALWLETDDKYKSAAEGYQAKISAMKQQNLPEELANLPDFSKAPQIKKYIEPQKIKFEKEKWEKLANQISAIFKSYPKIFASYVTIGIFEAQAYFVNSEGTETKCPITFAAIQVNAFTQADDGEPLLDHVLFYGLTPDDFPSFETIAKEIKTMADNLTALREAPIFDESYSGPVLFEGQAVAEMFAQRYFTGSAGLNATRKPIYSDTRLAMLSGKTMDSEIDKRVISKDISVKAVPYKKVFDGVTLIGNFEIDAEGVEPPKELILIENGILKTLLNGRVPNPKVKESNGHNRYALSNGELSSAIAPGVIEIKSNEGLSEKEIKDKLIQKAKEEGLEYAIIVKKIQSPTSGLEQQIDVSSIMNLATGGSKEGTIPKPIYVYKIYVKDGREELVRTVELGSISNATLKKIIGASEKQFPYNTILNTSKSGISGIIFFISSFIDDTWTINGVPASFIVPNSILVEELEVSKEKRPITIKLPIVENPITK